MECLLLVLLLVFAPEALAGCLTMALIVLLLSGLFLLLSSPWGWTAISLLFLGWALRQAWKEA